MGKMFKRIIASIVVISIMFNSGLAEIISYADIIDVNKIKRRRGRMLNVEGFK